MKSGRVKKESRADLLAAPGVGRGAGVAPVVSSEVVKVHFEYYDPSAKSVFIAGGFNDWHPAASEMICLGSGRWVKELLLKPGTHEYRLVVDGVWRQDPGSPLSTPNPFGERNSIRLVDSAEKRSH